MLARYSCSTPLRNSYYWGQCEETYFMSAWYLDQVREITLRQQSSYIKKNELVDAFLIVKR